MPEPPWTCKTSNVVGVEPEITCVPDPNITTSGALTKFELLVKFPKIFKSFPPKSKSPAVKVIFPLAVTVPTAVAVPEPKFTPKWW